MNISIINYNRPRSHYIHSITAICRAAMDSHIPIGLNHPDGQETSQCFLNFNLDSILLYLNSKLTKISPPYPTRRLFLGDSKLYRSSNRIIAINFNEQPPLPNFGDALSFDLLADQTVGVYSTRTLTSTLIRWTGSSFSSPFSPFPLFRPSYTFSNEEVRLSLLLAVAIPLTNGQ